MKPRNILVFRPQGRGHCSSFFVPLPVPLLFHTHKDSPYPGAVVSGVPKAKKQARLRTLDSLFALQLWATFYTSLSLSFFHCKLEIITVLTSQGLGEN